MNQTDSIIVMGRDGLRGVIDRAAWPPRAGETQVLVRLENGQQVLVPVEALVLQADGSYFLPVGFGDVERQVSASNTQVMQQADQNVVVPIVVEELEVQKRRIETGRVRLTKMVREHEEVVDEPLLREQVTVERETINRVVDTPQSVRYEGDTMIVPVLEEMLVVEKRLVLREEIRITKQQVERREPQRVTVRSEEVIVERVEGIGYQKGDGTDIA